MRLVSACLLALLLAGSGGAKFEVRDVRSTHGQFGPARKAEAYVPGDELYYGFTVSGAKLDKDGQLNMEMNWRVTGPDGKEVAKDAIVIRAQLALGGDEFPAKFSFAVGQEMTAGEYKVVVELTDREAGTNASFERTFSVKPTELALVQVRAYHDADGRAPAPAHKVVGETLFVRAIVVGFDKSGGEIDVDAEMMLTTPDGKRTAAKPVRVTFHEENPETVKAATVLRAKYQVALNRTGEFVVRIVCTEKRTKKTAAFEFPIRVTDR